MMDRRSSTIASLFGTLLLATMLAVGGCSTGSLTGPQPADNVAAQSEDAGTIGGAATNGDGTAGSAGHNVSSED